MKIQKLSKLLLLVSILLWNACKDKNDPVAMVAVGNDGTITLLGKNVELENLKVALLDTLTKMSPIPDSIEVKFGDEILMGMRGEVKTEVNEAITLAKESKLKPIIVNSTFRKEKGADCDQPDTLRTNCAVIQLAYPKVYFKESALQDSVNIWVHNYLTSILISGLMEEENVSPIATLDDAAKVFFDTHESYKGSAMYGAFVAESNSNVLLNNGKYITLEINGYTFQGGAHGSPTALVATFDAQTGKQLTWDNLVTDKAALQALAEKKFKEVRADVFQDGFQFDEIFSFKLPDNYGLTGEGIYFHYLAYEVGPYAIGNTTFTLTFDELGALAKLNANKQAVNESDRMAIETLIHDFYKWYDIFQKDETRNIYFVNNKDGHLTLNMQKLEQYFNNLESGGFISKDFIENERNMLKKCEKLWQNESADEVPSCLDADRFFCAQDWDLEFWTKASVKAEGFGADEVTATLTGSEGGGPRAQIFELKKENGRWLITSIPCDMGVQ